MKLWLGLLLLWPLGVAAAETVVVKDVLPINVRSGPATSFSIVAAVKSGQQLTVLEKKSGYYKVRTPKNNEGWVLARFVQNGPVAQAQLQAAMAERDQAVAQQQTTKDKLTQLQQRYDDLDTRYQRQVAVSEKVQVDASQCATQPAAQPVSPQEALPQQVAPFALDCGDTPRRNMLLGAGILLAGILLGLIIPLLRPRKRASV